MISSVLIFIPAVQLRCEGKLGGFLQTTQSFDLNFRIL